MRKYFLLLFCFPFAAIAQLSDNFSDGNFTANPPWFGKTDSFEVDNGMLRSNGPQVSSNIYLTTANSLIDSTEWSFLIQLEFNPSSTNYVRVYLVADQQNLSGSLNGYYVQYGAAGTAPDSLIIYKQTGTTSTKIFAGVQGCMASASTNRVRVKVVRHSGGSWDVYADCTGGTNYTYEGSFTDNAITTTSWFGVACRYTTASRYNLYRFDDFVIDYLRPDTTKPIALSVTNIASANVDVVFSEAVETASSQTISNYTLSNGVGNPTSATRDAMNTSLVHLTFSTPLQNATNYTLNISGVKDLAGNTMLPASLGFSLYSPTEFDVLINEIMADPSPVVGLPDVEFIELYNRSSFAINLNGWKFADATSSVTLPSFILQPDSFVVLCRQDSAPLFQTFGQVLPLSSLPSLNNGSDNLSLKDNNNNLIHAVNYSSSWYRNTTKANGGWTLELINPLNPCKEDGNWIASDDVSGGTPGRRNSVWNPGAASLFTIAQLNVTGNNSLEITFTEVLNASSAQNTANYTVDNSIGNPQTATIDSVNKAKVTLVFSSPFVANVLYTVTVSSVTNCSGIALSGSNTKLFALPQNPAAFDVLIHELLPDPTPTVGLPDAEFVELYNRSNKTFNLKDWVLTKPGQNGATLPDYLLLPDSFLILTSVSNATLFSSFGNVLGLSSFPALTNSGDQILLKDKAANIVHYVSYNDTWYIDNGKKEGGWTLEMIDAQNPCNGADKWRASVDSRGGTPGKQNSVQAANPDTILPRVLRAYLDGTNTLVLLFNEPLNIGAASFTASYSVDNGIGQPALALPLPFDYSTVRLEFIQAFQSGIIYTITVSNSVLDCTGNSLGMYNTARFAIPDSVEPNDVVLNEILFDPKTSGFDFVELYNRSNKVIDLKQLDIIERDVADPTRILEAGSITAESWLLFPNEFVALSESTDNIIENYFVPNRDMLLKAPIPNFPDKEGICVLKIHNGLTVDSLLFNQNWHYSLLDDKNGVSLERVDYNKPTQDKSNWHSAASSVGFATPTYINSQFGESGIFEDNIGINPEVFTPDNDGVADYTYIQYKFDEPGYTINIRLYDAVGREIKNLVRNETLGSEGQFQWDGTDDDGKKARVGIYFAFIEVFNLQGKVKRFKKQLVLGAKLN